MSTFLRRLKGAIGNALVWGAAWATVTALFWGGWLLLGFGGVPVAQVGLWLSVMCLVSGVSGVVTGLLFSLYLGVVHRDSGVLDLSVVRSALAGAVVAAAIPVLMNVVWLASIDFAIAPIGAFTAGAVGPAVMGGLTAGATVYLARASALEAHAALNTELEAEQREVDRLLS